MVIKLVSVDRLKKEFNDIEIDKINELSNAEIDKLVESLVLKSFKGFKKGKIYDNADLNDGIDGLDKVIDAVESKYKNSNIRNVIASRKFTYMYKAYLTADQIVTNNLMQQLNLVHHDLVSNLHSNIKILKMLLFIYYHNYSNSGMLQELMFKLSADDDIPLTFEIHDKYVYGDEFGVNIHLMNDLDLFIKGIVNIILYLIKTADKMFDADLDADGEIDVIVTDIKELLKNLFSNADDFETVIISETGLDDALIDRIGIMKESISLNKKYSELKTEFQNLYDDNAFKELAADDFEIYKKDYPDADIDDFMKKKPKYDLKKCKMIKPEINGINKN